MNRLLAPVAIAGVALALSACVYYPDGPYGPGYGPYHSAYGHPPPQGNYGPPPQENAGPPPGNYGPNDDQGPDDQQGYAGQGGPSGQDGDMSAGQSNKADKAMAKMSNPAWCSKHQKKCDKLHAKYGDPGQEPDSDGPPQ